MGLRFRRSIKVAPGVKLNINKKSSSITFGTKGVHVTKSTTGKTTRSVGIPGTGISYVETTGGNKAKSSHKKQKTAHVPDTVDQNTQSPFEVKPPKKKKSKLKKGLKVAGIGFAGLIVLGSLGGNGKESTTRKATSQVIETEIQTERHTEAKTEFHTEEQTEKQTQIQTESPTEKQTQAPTDEKKDICYVSTDVNVRSQPSTDSEVLTQLEAWSPVTVISLSNGWAQIDYNGQEAYVSAEYLKRYNAKEITVYISHSGSKYHSKSSCSNMDDPQPVSLYEAVNKGYDDCAKCNPPSY